MTRLPQALFLTQDPYTPTFRVSTYNHQRRFMQAAADAHWEVYASSWNSLQVAGSYVVLTRGLCLFPQTRSEQPIEQPTSIRPAYVNLHVSPSKKAVQPNALNTRALVDLEATGLITRSDTEYRITRAYAGYLQRLPALRYLAFSEHELFAQATGKWQMESCFRRGEKVGWYVARPNTEGVSRGRLPEYLHAVLQANPQPRIVKPHTGTRCEGIHVVTRQNLSEAVQTIRSADVDWYVVQELIHPTSTYQGHKVDLRVFVGVFSLTPLRYHVYRQGLARVAHKPFQLEAVDDLLVSLTGRSFRKRLGVEVSDLALETYLGHLGSQGHDTGALWLELQRLVENALCCLTLYPPLAQQPEVLKRVCPLLGFDILLREQPGRRLEPMVLEINYFPQLYGKGEVIDRQQDVAYRLFFGRLAEELNNQRRNIS